MRTKNSLVFTACLFALTHCAFAQQSSRVVRELELDPALSLGSRVRVAITPEPSDARRPAGGASFSRRVGSTYWNRPYFYWTRGTYEGGTLIGAPSMIDTAPLTYASRPAPPTVEEIAEEALREKRYPAAAAHGEQLHEPGEAASDRYIVSLEGAGRTGRAAALLAERVLLAGDVSALIVDRDGLIGASEGRRTQRLAASYADEAPDPNAWVLLASYFAGQGQREAAWRAIEKGVEGGLDPAVARALSGLKPEPPSRP